MRVMQPLPTHGVPVIDVLLLCELKDSVFTCILIDLAKLPEELKAGEYFEGRRRSMN